MQKFCYIFLILTLLIPTSKANTLAQKFSPVIIKSTTNRDEPNTGDYFIANDLEKAFQELNLKTDIDYRTEYHRPHTPKEKLSIYMRGYTKFYAPFDQGYNILYVYYPMAFDKLSPKKINKNTLNKRPPMPKNANLDDDFQNYDLIAVASLSYAKKLKNSGINAVYVPQFTNPDKFYPNFSEDLKTDILFVGSNWHDRTSLRYAIEAGFDVSVYGYNWTGYIPQELNKGTYIPNDILNKYYSSAKIVLNDHRPDMKAYGFINNRIYDATATGTLVISDYIKEIEDIYQGCVPTYKTKEELISLLNYYLTHEEERLQKAQCAKEITLKNFTHTQIAKTLLESANQNP